MPAEFIAPENLFEKKETKAPRLYSLLIERVGNGFIVTEDAVQDRNMGEFSATVKQQKVFESKRSLNKFINDNI